MADAHAGADLDQLITAVVTGVANEPALKQPPGRSRDLQLYVHLPAGALSNGDTNGEPAPADVQGLGPTSIDCRTHAHHCDLDHIVAYDEDGPPGQTHPANLAPLCRRHHRAKTAQRWHYRRMDDGSYAWTSPHGDRYLVADGATLASVDH